MNKKLLSFLLIGCVFFQYLYAQRYEECGNDILFNNTTYKSYKTSGKRPSNQLFPFNITVVRDDNGNTNITTSDINNAIDDLNLSFAAIGLEFYICGSINYVDNSGYYDFKKNDENALAGTRDQSGKINLYIVNSICGDYNYSTNTCELNLAGYAYYPGSGINRIFMKSARMNQSTFPHEVGHFFNLIHTHGGQNGSLTNELVNGSNCSSEGDLLCDTPADPQLSYNNVSSNCYYTGNVTDANGDYFNPDEENFMSYSRKSCRDEFTSDQYNRMLAAANSSDRNFFNCSSIPCNLTLSDYSAQYSPSSHTNEDIQVTALSACQWSASSSVPWVNITSGNSGSGNGTISYTVQSNSDPNSRSGYINVSGEQFQITQNGLNCSYSLSSNQQTFGNAQVSSSSFNVSAANGCSWSAISNKPWVSILSQTGNGNGTVDFSVSANNTQSQRQAEINVQGEIFTVIQGGISCSYSFSPGSQNYSDDFHYDQISVSASNSNCEWNASTTVSWINLLNASGKGNDNLYFEIDQNPSQNARSGQIVIGSATFDVQQDAATCYNLINPQQSQILSRDGASASFVFQTPTNCSWSASTIQNWINISNSSGMGAATIQYSVTKNQSLNQRVGYINVGARSFIVVQDSGRCFYDISPQSLDVSQSQNQLDVEVFTESFCEWAASSNVNWLTVISGSNGFGNGTITIEVSENQNTQSRTGYINIAGKNLTVNQEGAIDNINDVTNRNKSDHIIGLFPNPNTGQFHISLESKTQQEVELSIVSVVGKEVYRSGNFEISGQHTQSVNLENIASGMYLLKVNLGEQSITRKIFIQKN